MEERGTHLFRKLLDEPAGSSDKALSPLLLSSRDPGTKSEDLYP